MSGRYTEKRRAYELVNEQVDLVDVGAVGGDAVGVRHLLEQLDDVDGDVSVFVAKQADERRHDAEAHENAVEVRDGRDGVEALELLVKIGLALNKPARASEERHEDDGRTFRADQHT